MGSLGNVFCSVLHTAGRFARPGSLLAMLAIPLIGTAAQEAGLNNPAEPLRTVRVQLKWTHQFQFAGYYAAIEQGYYREVGLNVELIEYSPGVGPIDQLMGGRVEFAVTDAGALLYRATGVPLVALAAIFQNSPSILISLADSSITELADLENKRAMLSGGFMNAELMSMLQRAGIDSDEIELLPTDTSIDVLIEGGTDAYNGYTTNEPYLLEQRGVPYRIFMPSDYDVDFYGDILITNEATIAADPDMVAAFREATLRGWGYATENPQAVVDLILARYNTQNKTRDHLLFEAQEAIKLILPNVVPIGYMNVERWQRIADIFREQGILTQNQDVDLDSFLYDTGDSMSLQAVLWRYRVAILISVILLAGMMLLAHIIHLRSQINARTRELNAARLHAEEEARTDPLTGLPNRRQFLEELSREVAQVQRFALPLAVASIDIDFFKTVNDKFGHAAGDAALRQTGLVLVRIKRKGDLVARIGGEEFVLVCRNSDREQARHLAARLSQEMAKTPINHAGDSFHITCSIGLAEYEPGDDEESLLRKADLALYSAKQGGRDRIVAWRPGME